MVIWPLSKLVRSSKLLTKVVFPAPLGPKSPKKDPFSREREKFDNALNPPNVLVRLVAFIIVESILFSMRNSTIEDFFLASKKPKNLLNIALVYNKLALISEKKREEGRFLFQKKSKKSIFFYFLGGIVRNYLLNLYVLF